MQIDDILKIIEPYWIQYGDFALAIIAIIIVWIIQRILVRSAKNSVKNSQLPPEAANGIILGIRIASLFIIFTILTSIAGLSSEALALSGFVGAAVGFASAQTIGNIIAGIYVILTRPFGIGEYIKIGSDEGIVKEISLNYTRIEAPDGTDVLVPNKSVVNQRLQRFLHEITEDDPERDTALSFLRDSLGPENEVYIYPFDVAVHASYSMETTTKVFDEVCQEWKEKFGHLPTYYVSELPSYQIKYKFNITVVDPRKILQLQPEFLKALIGRLEETKE